MVISKTRAKRIAELMKEVARIQDEFWQALQDLENETDRDIDSTGDCSWMADGDVTDFFNNETTRLLSGQEFKGTVTVRGDAKENNAITGG
jgi:hypothetical protein